MPLDEASDATPSSAIDLISLDDALNSLHQIDPRQNRIVELKFFGGLEIAEIAGISPATVKRDWAWAREWLHRELNKA